MKLRQTVISAGVIVIMTASAALAQPPLTARSGRPTTSPYLNLLRGRDNGFGGGTGFNYYQRVRPQAHSLRIQSQLNQTLQQVQGEQLQLRRQQTKLQKTFNSGLAPTGHQTSFLDYRGYYKPRRR